MSQQEEEVKERVGGAEKKKNRRKKSREGKGGSGWFRTMVYDGWVSRCSQ